MNCACYLGLWRIYIWSSVADVLGGIRFVCVYFLVSYLHKPEVSSEACSLLLCVLPYVAPKYDPRIEPKPPKPWTRKLGKYVLQVLSSSRWLSVGLTTTPYILHSSIAPCLKDHDRQRTDRTTNICRSDTFKSSWYKVLHSSLVTEPRGYDCVPWKMKSSAHTEVMPAFGGKAALSSLLNLPLLLLRQSVGLWIFSISQWVSPDCHVAKWSTCERSYRG